MVSSRADRPDPSVHGLLRRIHRALPTVDHSRLRVDAALRRMDLLLRMVHAALPRIHHLLRRMDAALLRMDALLWRIHHSEQISSVQSTCLLDRQYWDSAASLAPAAAVLAVRAPWHSVFSKRYVIRLVFSERRCAPRAQSMLQMRRDCPVTSLVGIARWGNAFPSCAIARNSLGRPRGAVPAHTRTLAMVGGERLTVEIRPAKCHKNGTSRRW